MPCGLGLGEGRSSLGIEPVSDAKKVYLSTFYAYFGPTSIFLKTYSAYFHVCVCLCIFMYNDAQTCITPEVYVSMCIGMGAYLCSSLSLHICACIITVCVHVCIMMCVHTYVYIRICIYMYVCTRASEAIRYIYILVCVDGCMCVLVCV